MSLNQLSLIVEDDPSIEAAKHLIRVYVHRGDDISYLSNMGASSPDSYSVTIGGYSNGKKVTNHQIAVSRDMNGQPVDKVYDLVKIFNEVKAEK